MATSSPRFTWCSCRKHKIPVKDPHELCLHCLGIGHAKEAVLDYGRCPHCAKMDWSTCINRLTKVQEVMHRESQQRKQREAAAAAQSEGVRHPKPETTPAPIGAPKPERDPVVAAAVAPSSRLSAVVPPHSSSALPVMFTILSPPPSHTLTNPGVAKGSFLSQLAIQQSADSTPSVSQSGSHGLTAGGSRKRRHLPSCRSRCAKRSKRSGRGAGHRRRRSPSSSSSSSSSSPYWTSGDDSCASGAGRRSRRESSSRRRGAGFGGGRRRRHGAGLAEALQQRLEAQQQAVQLQWALLDKRIEALERRGAAESAVSLSLSTPPPLAQTTYPSAAPPLQQTATSCQEAERRRERSGSASERLVTESVSGAAAAAVKQEEEPSSVSRPLSDADGERQEEEEAASQSAQVGSASRKDFLDAAELQSLVARAASYLGVDFPSATPASSGPPDPTMVPEFEDLVQSSWHNPASSKAYGELLPETYRLHERQSPAYDQMPQVSRFMSAIFQAVKPAEEEEATQRAPPAERWRLTENLVEKMYETAGMLAKTANYLRYLSDYQRRLLAEVAADDDRPPAQRLATALNELKLIGQFTFQLSSHQAELSGRVMAASVAIRRQVWMAKTNYTDSLKATVADLPFVVSHTFGVGSGPGSTGTMCKQERA